MAMNVEETKVVRISRQDKRTAGECGIFQLIGKHDNIRCKMYVWN